MAIDQRLLFKFLYKQLELTTLKINTANLDIHRRSASPMAFISRLEAPSRKGNCGRFDTTLPEEKHPIKSVQAKGLLSHPRWSGRFSLQRSSSKTSQSRWRMSSGFSRRTSRTASHVCQCTTTLTGPQRTTRVFATRIHHKSLSTPRSVAWDIGLSSALETKKHGTGHSPTTQWRMESKRRGHDAEFRARTQCSEEPVILQE